MRRDLRVSIKSAPEAVLDTYWYIGSFIISLSLSLSLSLSIAQSLAFLPYA